MTNCDFQWQALILLNSVVSKPLYFRYEYTPPDTMTETLNTSVEGTPPKKRAQKLKEETPVKESFAGSKSKEVSSLQDG